MLRFFRHHNDVPTVDPRLSIVLNEAIRAIEGQKESLDNLRARIGILLSAATIATSFLGGLVLDDGEVGWIGIAAIGLFVVHVLVALWILWPREWTFSHGHEGHGQRLDGDGLD